MPPSSFEVALQTAGSLLSDCLVDKNGAPVVSKDALNQLVIEMFPHCEKFHMIDDSLMWVLRMRSSATAKVTSCPASVWDKNLSEGEEIPL
ncbi:UNVERIFIED_CONTAM: hypothetical protein K2H54_022487 [Gekko kuhli]